MPATVGILTLMSGKNFMLNCVEHEISFITSGPGMLGARLSRPELLWLRFFSYPTCHRGCEFYGPGVSWAQHTKSGSHSSPFAALSFPNSKKYPFTAELTVFSPAAPQPSRGNH